VKKFTGVDEKGRGSGLFSMKERVRIMGGECSIESHPGRGTTVSVVIPLTGSVNNAED
jgi:signal transduction histidine kinase